MELRFALSTLFPKHGDEAKIIRCEIISTEEAKSKILRKNQNQKTSLKNAKMDYCPIPTPQTQEVS